MADGLLHNERPEHTLQPTALVHEVFLQLVNLHRVALNDRAHFFTFAAKLMRRILIDHARRLKAAKRPLALDELEALDGEKARSLELEKTLAQYRTAPLR